jgi:hypothetical protein
MCPHSYTYIVNAAIADSVIERNKTLMEAYTEAQEAYEGKRPISRTRSCRMNLHCGRQLAISLRRAPLTFSLTGIALPIK